MTRLVFIAAGPRRGVAISLPMFDFLFALTSFLALLPAFPVALARFEKFGQSCTVYPNGNKTDDSPSILGAFRSCGLNGKISFINETYWIERVMNTTGLKNVEIDLKGTLLVRFIYALMSRKCDQNGSISVVSGRYSILAE